MLGFSLIVIFNEILTKVVLFQQFWLYEKKNCTNIGHYYF